MRTPPPSFPRRREQRRRRTPPDFVLNRPLMIELDRVARRYRKLPTELLDLDPVEWGLVHSIAVIGSQQDEADHQDYLDKMKKPEDRKARITPARGKTRLASALERKRKR